MKRWFLLVFLVIIFYLLILFFLALIGYFVMYPRVCQAQGKEITFAWEYDANIIELFGFFLYEKDQNQSDYDYNQPVSSLIGKDARQYTQENVSYGSKSWVLRARAIDGTYSDNSNEITYDVPLISPSRFNVNGLVSGDMADILFMDGKALPGMLVISYDQESDMWQFKRPGEPNKDFFVPAGAIKAIVRKK